MKLSVMDERAEELLSSGRRRHTRRQSFWGGGCSVFINPLVSALTTTFPFRYLKLIDEC